MDFQTPQRPLPGAFFNTPAPSRYPPPRQPVFQVNAGANTSNQPSNPNPQQQGLGSTAQRELPRAQTLQPIQRAARTINEVLQREGAFPDLDSYVRQGTSSDYDLPNTTNEISWQPFQRTEMHAMPDKIFDQYNRGNISTMMGLFSELNHAWVTIDNCFYLWDYTASNPDLIGFEEQNNCITAVKLVKPRAGLFQKNVQYLLVVATTAEMILLGVSIQVEASDPGARIQGQERKTISLYRTNMTLGIRGINVQVIEGSAATGRIFFTGKDNPDVYELTYQQEERWFASRCGKVNQSNPGYTSLMPAIWTGKKVEFVQQMVVDDTRRLVYTLSNESTIRTYYMDSPTTLQHVIEKKRLECLRDISHMISQSPLLTNTMKIVSISAISAKEGTKLHLMATTNTGCRLFISATRGYGYMNNTGAPQNMQVQHIKFPPRVEPRTPNQSQAVSYPMLDTTIDTSSLALSYTEMGLRFAPGLFFCFTKKDDGKSTALFLSGPDTGRISAQARDLTGQASRYYEQACWINLNSHAEDIGLVTKPFAAARGPVGFGNELAVQYDEAPQEIAILTDSGVHVIRRRRLVDVFAASLGNHGGDKGLENEIKKFIRYYGRAETTATALAVACGQGSDVSPGDSPANLARVTNPDTVEAARKAFVEFGGRPSLNENMVSEGPLQAVDNVRPSSRHDGLALYMARLVRSLWKAPVIEEKVPTSGGGPVQITSTVSSTKLTSIQDNLMKLATFLEKNKSFIEGLAGPESLQRVTSQQEEVALQGEHQALYSLQKLNLSIIEGISFVQMLFDERVDEIWTSLDDGVRQRLRELKFEVLFSLDQGKDLAKVLVKAIVNRNIANGSNVDTVAEALRRRCGSFCSADDVIIFKAQEHLKKASEVGANSDMGRSLLNESLKLFQQVAGSLSYENLESAANQFTALQFYAGAISLALLVAHESDRGNRALSWVNENRPADDPRVSAYVFRKECYDLIHAILVAVDRETSEQPDAIDGRQTLAFTKRNEAHAVVNESDDELFQYDLYDWYLNQGWVDILLAVDSEFVVLFLKKSAASSLDKADLLWRYYTHRNNFFEAAAVQLELAKSNFAIPLTRRIEYLSRAKANASAQSLGIGRTARQVLQYEVGELLEVANIQDELLRKLRGDTRIPRDRMIEVVGKLDSQIMDLSTLFNDYADEASYYDICLEIYGCADHRNESDIAATWQQLIDSTHNDIITSEIPDKQQPFEAIVSLIRTMSRRLSKSEATFSPHLLVPMLERYAIENQTGAAPDTFDSKWLPDLFLEVGFPFETIVALLQAEWFNNAAPFVGRRRGVLVEHCAYVLDKWMDDCVSGNKVLFGGEENCAGILGLVEGFGEGGVGGSISVGDREVLEKLRRRLSRVVGR